MGWPGVPGLRRGLCDGLSDASGGDIWGQKEPGVWLA